MKNVLKYKEYIGTVRRAHGSADFLFEEKTIY